MGLRRLGSALSLGAILALGAVGPAAAFDGFGEATADSTYGREIRFDVQLRGPAPERLELVLRFGADEAAVVVPVDPRESAATYVWDTSVDYVTPNTLITYEWRAIDGGELVTSGDETIRYVDDRPGLEWQTAQLGETTVHWYGDAATQAMRFGELAATGVERGEELLGTALAGPVDVFVYDSREEFFGALGPGAREWTGAAAYPPLRTIFMWLEGRSQEYLETAIVHEVTHIVFFDATDNPYHEPASWLNEGIATWSETGDGAAANQLVRSEAGNGLFAFDAIAEQFPIGGFESSLAYAQGTAMIDFIIDSYGADAIARLTAAYREGASDAEALEAATGESADALFAAFYEAYGAEEPAPVSPEPIPASEVEIPEAGAVDPGGVAASADPSTGPSVSAGDPDPTRAEASSPILVFAVLGVAILAVALLAFGVWRRARREPVA